MAPDHKLNPNTLVRVTPRYLAGPRDPGEATSVAWPFRPEDGWTTYTPFEGPILSNSPDQRIQAAFLPDTTNQGGGSWTVAGYDNPAGSPQWRAVFDYGVPEEILGAFHHAVHVGHNGDRQLLSASAPTSVGYQPLLDAGWRHETLPGGQQTVTAPDSNARLTYDDDSYRRRDNYVSWRLNAGEAKGAWNALFTVRTPVPLIAAFTTAMVTGEPLTRTIRQLPPANFFYLTITPAPAAPAPAHGDQDRAPLPAPVPPTLPSITRRRP
ncbi:protein of unknown function DUF317 [Actinobacteria bacterium OK074]|nr:protein of unknown function DUF317 [Actinobacteria bacterium OK074]